MKTTFLIVILLSCQLGFVGSFATADEAEPDLPALIELLNSPLEAQMREATHRLARIGDKAAPALDRLIYVLDHSDQQIWNEATQAIANLGPAGAPAIDELLKRGDSRDEQRRYRTAYALGCIGPVGLPKLREHLSHDSRNVREVVIDAMSRMGPEAADAIPDLILRLQDEDSDVRAYATKCLGKIGAAAVEPLIRVLDNEQSQVVAGAARALADMGPAASDAMLQLLELANHKDVDVRAQSLRGLGRIDVNNEAVIQPLLAGLNASDEIVRREAVGALMRLAPNVKSAATPLLANELATADSEAAARIALVLGGFGSRAVAAVPALLEYLTSHPETTDVARAVGRIGEPAVAATFESLRAGRITALQVSSIISAMPAHVKARMSSSMDDENPQVRAIAAYTIGGLVPLPRDAVAQLERGLQDADADVRAAVAKSLKRIGVKKASAAVPSLVQALSKEDSESTAAAVEIISAIGELQSDSGRLLEALSGYLNAPSDEVKSAAMSEFSKLDSLPESLHATLVKHMHHADPSVRCLAAKTIVLIKEHREQTADLIVAAMSDEVPSVREQALMSVPQLGDAAKSAVDVIRSQLADEQPAVRVAAVQSLARIGKRSAADALDQVAELVVDSNADVRKAVVKSVRKLTSDSEKLLPVLIKAIDDEDWGVSGSAAEELGAMEEAAAPAVPALFKMLLKDDSNDAASRAIREISTADEEAVPVLLDILQDGKAGRRSRYYAVYVLRKMGRRAKSALPVLEELVEKEEGRTREELQRVIRGIKK